MTFLPFLILLTTLTPAQNHQIDAQDWCEEQTPYALASDATYCEVRTITLPSASALRVEASPNGSIRAEGENRANVVVQARVWTRSRSDERARELADGVTIRTDGTLRYELAKALRPVTDRPWNRLQDFVSVSFRLHVPHAQDLELTTMNGGIDIREIQGQIRFESLNGSVRLSGLSGDVQGHTINGRLCVRLTGNEWRGGGLNASTTNGRVDLEVPNDYSAELEAGTVNGRFRADLGRIGVAMGGQGRARQLATTLGDGGAPVRVRTTNGRVQIDAH